MNTEDMDLFHVTLCPHDHLTANVFTYMYASSGIGYSL